MPLRCRIQHKDSCTTMDEIVLNVTFDVLSSVSQLCRRALIIFFGAFFTPRCRLLAHHAWE